MQKFKFLFISLVLIIILLSGCSSNQKQKNPYVMDADSFEDQAESVIPIQTEFNIDNEKIILEKVTLFDGKVEILMPSGFTLMSDEVRKSKYPPSNLPDMVYIHNKSNVSISIGHTETPLTDSQVHEMVSRFKSMYEKNYQVIGWGGYQVATINGKQVGIIQPLIKAVDSDTNNYSYAFFCELDGKLLAISLDCTEKQVKDWDPIGKAMVNSLRIVK